jgi:VIT1/CCC1 family predicted Fe2+/Mn2+ transporter
MNKTKLVPNEAQHKSQRSPWLRAAVLGVNDGIVSTSSLMLGVLGATSNQPAILTAGIAGLVAGALSMGVGEYVSVSSQKDSEKADIDIEKKALADHPEQELAELALIYESRGVDTKTALVVAKQLHAFDAVDAHARDELHINQKVLANPMQAAVASIAAFSLGALIPIAAALVSGGSNGFVIITVASLAALAISGTIGAFIGGGDRTRATLRVLAGGVIGMAITYGIGLLIGQSI